MVKINNGSWQEWLIAFALLWAIPATVWLGVQLIAPKIDEREYSKQLDQWRKTHDFALHSAEQRKEDTKEWEKTDFFLNFEKNSCVKFLYDLIICGTFSIILFYVGLVFAMPIVAASLIFCGIILQAMPYRFADGCFIVFNINTLLLEIVFAFVGLMILCYGAYKKSEI